MKNKNIVLYCDKGYHELALSTIESFDRVNDNFTFYYFTIDFTPTINRDNVVICPINNVKGIPHPQLMKPTVLRKALDYVDEFIYVDCDLIASKHFDYNSYIKHVDTYPYSPLLHETAWQKPIYYWHEEGERKELDETLMLEYLGVKKRTQKWATTLMVGVNQTCKKFIKEWENICLTKDLWTSKKTPSHLEPFREYFHIGDETPFNVLLWKKGVTNYLHKGAVLEPKKLESFIAAETQNLYNTRLEPDNPITDCIDSSKLFVYHQLKDLKFRNQILNSLTQDQSKKFLFVCSFYNNPEEHIDITFSNVLKQTHKNWILIVGDDFSSTPGFRGLLKRKVEEINDPRIIYYDIQFKRELYLYQNFFLELEYDYYFDLDSDDILHERTLELYDQNFTQYPKTISIFSDYIKVSDEGKKQQYSLINSSLDYNKEFTFRHNGTFKEVYAKRSGQSMFGHARCMRRPDENKIHIEKNCKTSTDSLFLFYNLNRGNHLHLPRRLYTYVNREGSDSGMMSSEEYSTFNTNAAFYMDSLQTLNQPSPYKSVWLETSALSSCDFLSQIDSLSLISDLEPKKFKLIKSLYPDKDIVLNDFNHKNQVVVWGKLNKRIKSNLNLNSTHNCTVFYSNEDFSTPSENIIEQFNISSSKFISEINSYLENYNYYNYFRQCIVTRTNLLLKPKLLVIQPHLSTGGCPQYLIEYLTHFSKNFSEIKVIEVSNFSNDFIIQKNKLISLLGKENIITLGNFQVSEKQWYKDKKKLLKIINEFNPSTIWMNEAPEGFEYKQIPHDILNEIYSLNRKYKIIETTHYNAFNFKSKQYIPDEFLFCSHKHIKDSKHIDIPKKVWEVPIKNQIRPDRNQTLTSLGLDPSKYHILNVGLFNNNKNQKYIFNLASQTKDLPIQYHFIGNTCFIGECGITPSQQNLPNCKIWGERSDVDIFMSCMDLYLFPSKKELNPLTIKESLSWGMDVIANYDENYTNQYKHLTNFNLLEDSTTLNWIKNQSSNMPSSYELPPNKIKITFTEGAKCEIEGLIDQEYCVKFYNNTTNKLIYEGVITNNMWTSPNYKFFIPWRVEIWVNGKKCKTGIDGFHFCQILSSIFQLFFYSV